MITFLKSIDNKTWKAVIFGWALPQVTDTDGKVSHKLEKDWTEDEDEASLENSRALNAIFYGVDNNIFRLINTCVFAKEA